MSESGYKTGLVGKWHLGAGKPFRPTRRGFREFFGFLGGGPSLLSRSYRAARDMTVPMWRNGKTTDDQLTYLTDDLTDEAEKFIERNGDQPFLLMLMYNAPHAPDHVTEKYMSRVASIKHEGRRRYAALVQGVDEGVGRIVAKLNALDIAKKTLCRFS